jgi:hypothetical protein
MGAGSGELGLDTDDPTAPKVKSQIKKLNMKSMLNGFTFFN